MRLRELQEKDADRMLSWMHSEKSKDIFAKKFNNFTKEAVLSFIRKKNTSENINYACVDDDDNYLGTISLKNIDYENKNAEYAISFMEEAQGTGAALYATKEILKLAFNDLKLKKVYLDVLETNTRANAFYKKVGFIYEGKFEKHILKNNQFIDLYWYRMFAEEFNQ